MRDVSMSSLPITVFQASLVSRVLVSINGSIIYFGVAALNNGGKGKLISYQKNQYFP